MQKIRPSALPRFFACASSAVAATAPYDPVSDAGNVGSAVHKALYLAVMHGKDQVDLSALACRYACELDELEHLYKNGLHAWRVLEKHFPAPQAEVALSSELGSGTADLLHVDKETAVVLDWKTGRVQRDYADQLTAYAYAVREQYGMPNSKKIITVVVWLRYGTFDVTEITDDALTAFRERFVAHVQQIGKQYAPGEHCGYCPRQLECTAKAAYLRSAGAAIAEQEPLTPTKLATLYSQARMLRKALEQYDNSLRLTLQAGDLPLGDGTTLTLTEHTRDVFDARAAWPILQSHGFNDEDLSRVVRMSKTSLMDVVGEKSTRGEKNKRRAQLLSDLGSAGAISKDVSTRIDRRKDAA